jgi:hypothetical protein
LLDLVSGGVTSRFSGSSTAATEADGREIAIRQQGLAGLTVTRKIFLPRDGYFARYLEVLQNPTATPITVDVRLTENFRPATGTSVVTRTSSGDAVLDVSNVTTADRWVVVDDFTDVDPFLQFSAPAVAAVFDGPGAPERVGAAQFSNINRTARRLEWRWTNVTVQAGTTVIYMHFLAQQ